MSAAMTIAQRVLRALHPESEKERMDFRMYLSKANAEAEDLTRTLADCCHLKSLKKKPNGDGRG